MKFFVSSKIIVMLIGFSAAILVGAGSAEADFIFGAPTNLGPVVNSYADEHPGDMSADGLTLYFSSRRPGGYSEWYDIYVSTRPTKDDPWEEPVNLGPAINTVNSDFEPDISPDGLTLVFSRIGPGGPPNFDEWITTRQTTADPWETRINLGSTVNSFAWDSGPSISADGLTLFIDSTRSGGFGDSDVWMTTRPTRDDPWSEPVNLGPTVNSSSSDGCPDISADGQTLFFNSRRSNGYGDNDIWVTRRPTVDHPWSEPVNLGAAINTAAIEGRPTISVDGLLLLFESNRPGGSGGSDIWQVPIIPIIDFNGDGIVDSADMCIMVDHWGESYSLCDIGPTPLGDGIVDTQDLIVLSEHLFEDMTDPTLVAHWALDEIEGMVVADSVGDNDGYALGGPVWQPDGGIIDGAIQLDGVDDYIVTGAVPDPAEGPFSILVWINGGAPGQVIISQSGGDVNWLLADPIEGNLMTELKGPVQDAVALQSQAIITDGQWHRIGLVWDGANRVLYVDDITVAEDTLDDLNSSVGDLYIGCGSNSAMGTFWSGLVDDVRIYKRVAHP